MSPTCSEWNALFKPQNWRLALKLGLSNRH
jgi:hypothetical protein